MSVTIEPTSVLPDILAPNLAIVFCGTAVGNVSAQRGAYYAGPGNRFWPTLHAVGLTPRLLQPEAYRDFVSFGLGLIDNVRMSTLWLFVDTLPQYVHGMDMFDADMDGKVFVVCTSRCVGMGRRLMSRCYPGVTPYDRPS